MKSESLHFHLFHLAISVFAIIILHQSVYAYSTIPKTISSDISGPIDTTFINAMQLQFVGKNDDNTSLFWEWENMFYGSLQNGIYSDGVSNASHPSYPGYIGSCNYLVITIHANGLGQIGDHPESDINLTIDGEPFHIRLPSFTIKNETDVLSLYVADDGSTFWAHHDNGPNYINTGSGNQNIEDSLSHAPSDAFKIEHIAANGKNPIHIPGAIWPLDYEPIKLSGNGLVVTGELVEQEGTIYRSEVAETKYASVVLGDLIRPTAINYDGSNTVGLYINNPSSSMFCFGARSFSWEESSTPSSFYNSGDYGNEAFDISDDGVFIVGGSHNTSSIGACVLLWDKLYLFDTNNNTYNLLDLPEGISFFENAFLSGNGKTIIATCAPAPPSDSRRIYKWTETDGFELIGDGVPVDISNDANIIVGTSPDGDAFRYTENNGFQTIGDFQPIAANADCTLVVGTLSGNPVIWEKNNGVNNFNQFLVSKGIDLDTNSWVINSVADISDDGRSFIGVATNNSDGLTGWITAIEENALGIYFIDEDGDGYGNVSISIAAVTEPEGYVSNNLDCDDSNAAINPSAPELADDGIDQNCDGEDLITACMDRDGDGFYAENDCGSELDCNDNDAAILPGAKEVINDEIDQDCDGSDFRVDVEEGNIISVEFIEADDPVYSEDMPDSLVCDPIRIDMGVTNAEGTAVFIVNLINGAPKTYIPYKYTKDGWIDFSRDVVSGGEGDGAEFIDTERKQLKVYITDGGNYDNNAENAVISDPITVAAPGFVTPQGDVDGGGDSGGGSGGGGGCFIDLLH